ncbi:MAG: CbiX/SirB N-terminal domain-containing protein [Betaproteobacteria bacterium]|nr:CbiX/SirB N-terminal domain-containing protein [Betaproteobacteria bacterium]MDE2209005.1 CbiX/SirB N-terminal domain-containing protein [Betaproteobacteria bacterium]MDE2359107.1 CbiX/SirB N-terminal domain-containing protein [Betaproteobacteria bacterium]
MPSIGVILFVHGSPDARWAEPFRRLRDRVAMRAPDLAVTVAYLEHLQPDLATAAEGLARRGAGRIRIVPMFFGRGAHLREDLPAQVAAARARAPGVAFEVTESAGENDAVLDALAAFALAGT